MAYFPVNERRPPAEEETRRYDSAQLRTYQDPYPPGNAYDDPDDGLDDPPESEEDSEVSGESIKDILRNWDTDYRCQMVSGIGNLLLVILGVAVILLAVAMLISMGNFAVNDMKNRFTMLQTKF